jgi:hypothetical protein
MSSFFSPAALCIYMHAAALMHILMLQPYAYACAAASCICLQHLMNDVPNTHTHFMYMYMHMNANPQYDNFDGMQASK